jgi:prevent-host-death family protein
VEKIGAYEAKTHLSKLLERVAKGERFTIEKHGVPVAVLQPVDCLKTNPAEDTIAKMKEFRTQNRLDDLTIREMIEEGRK